MLAPCGFPWVGTAVAAAVPQRRFGVGRAKLTGTGGFGFPESLSCTSGHIWQLPVLQQGEVTVSPW